MLFEEQISRKPDKYPWTSAYMQVMWDNPWSPNKFTFDSDYQDFKIVLDDNVKGVVVRSLSAIAQIEVAVKTFWSKLGQNLPHPSIGDLGNVMANVETIHNKAYEKLLEKLEIESVFEENLNLPVIKGRVDYLRKYLKKSYEDNRKQYIYALILFTLYVENVSLFSQFYTIILLSKHFNVLKDTNQQIQYTCREEDIHARVGIRLINTLREEYPELFDQELEDRILAEAKSAFEAESKVIEWILNGYSCPGLNVDILKNFIKDRFNTSLKEIKYTPIFEVDSDLLESTEWFNLFVGADIQPDFFHQHPIGYIVGLPENVGEDWF